MGLLSRLLALACMLALPAWASASERVVSLDLCMDRMLALHADREQVAALSPMHKRFPLPWPLEGWPSHDGSLEQVFSLSRI